MDGPADTGKSACREVRLAVVLAFVVAAVVVGSPMLSSGQGAETMPPWYVPLLALIVAARLAYDRLSDR